MALEKGMIPNTALEDTGQRADTTYGTGERADTSHGITGYRTKG